MGVLPRNCERARSRVSLDLDNELSELEGAMLRAHTANCAACAAFATDATAITQSLRLAPLEPLPAPVTLPERRRSVGRFAQVGAAAAVAMLAVGIGTLLSSTPDSGRTFAATSNRPTATQLARPYLDAPRGLPQYPPIVYRPRLGLETGRSDA